MALFSCVNGHLDAAAATSLTSCAIASAVEVEGSGMPMPLAAWVGPGPRTGLPDGSFCVWLLVAALETLAGEATWVPTERAGRAGGAAFRKFPVHGTARPGLPPSRSDIFVQHYVRATDLRNSSVEKILCFLRLTYGTRVFFLRSRSALLPLQH